jgi:hypothetical protein
MQPEHLVYGGGSSETFLHPVVAVVMLVAMCLILTLPRNKVIVPFLLAFFSIPFAQVILVGPLHFPVLRVLILTGVARTVSAGGLTSKQRFPGGFNRIDLVVVLWSISAFFVVSVQWMDPQAFIKFVGDFMDCLGGYLVVRYFISDGEAVRRAIRTLALVCVIQGACMVSEQFTDRNVFDFVGGHPTTIREGHIRSEGVLGTLFGGTFGGVVIPLFFWLWTERKSRAAAFAGLTGAAAMVWSSHASTSWTALGAGLIGLMFWPIRKQMRLVRYGIVTTLVGLHLVMHGPVWSLIEKVDLTGGSSSYHRYMLVDNCIRHFSDWWLLGYTHYGDWGFDMWDLCNQFVAVALTGGLISLVLFIMIYSRSFGAIGRARKRLEGDNRQELLVWCLGATFFANVVASFGINYMVQLQTMLFVFLGCTSIAAFGTKPAVERATKASENALRVSCASAV